jgi:hypothetical protein
VKPSVLNISIARRSPWSQRFIVEHRVDGVYVPFPLTGWTGVASIKTEATATDSLAAPTVAILDEAGGVGEVSLTGAQTAAIPTTGKTFSETTSGVWDAYLVHATSPLSPMRVFNGSASVSPSVSEP